MDQACMICDAPTRPHTTKSFGGLCGLDEVSYRRCSSCGFVYSATHFAMPETTWAALNEAHHSGYQNSAANRDDPRWLARLEAQARVLRTLTAVGAIEAAPPWLDWGAGDGKLSRRVTAPCPSLLNYDRFMHGSGFLDEAALQRSAFTLVISTSVFEHVRSLATLDEIEALVATDGTFALHTFVDEEIPTDPNWFYYLPVHTAFYTNEAMRRLFARWGYTSSIYHADARLWLWFRDRRGPVMAAKANERIGADDYVGAMGFLDYWK